VIPDPERCYLAVHSRDARFDGWFCTAVRTTGIYCRPSCPAITPKRANVEFFPTAAAAQQAGYRACKRCRPDATPGSPEWNGRADVVARAMRLIADGLVDRGGVGALAARLGYSERQLQRLLVAEVGAGPLALARAQRTQTARLLVETTSLPITDVAFAAGFTSVRQFNDTFREVFAMAPGALRRAARTLPGSSGTLTLRLAVRLPFDGAATLEFLGRRAVGGIEHWDGATYRRSLRLAHGAGVVALAVEGDAVHCRLRLDDLADLQQAVQRCRRMLDLDADPVAVDEHLGADPLLGPLVAKRPGLRSPGHPDGAELVTRALLGQQVSVRGASTLAGRLVADFGDELPGPEGAVTHLFPTPGSLAVADPTGFGVPEARRRALIAANLALASGALTVDPGSDPGEVRAGLRAIRGIGEWTADYVALRALGDPDAFLPGDLGVRRALDTLGAVDASDLARRWRPWRAYALHHLWATLERGSRR
jgi:AraC family transcriptional regulator, regulatory protein of adaptative response / DNA-3-methyladenine glycosylase II